MGFELRISARAFLAAVVLAGALCGVAPAARAEQTRDWILAAQPSGTDVMLDAILPGVQATLEHRIPIYGMANQLTMRANSLLVLPLYESQADVDLRILALTLGGSAGFRDEFRTLEFAPNERIDRDHRRQRELDGNVSNEIWGFYEGRAILQLPLNDYMVFQSLNRYRVEGRPDRSYDWRLGLVHDGVFLSSDNMLFFKHRDWGGIAPVMQLVDFEIGAQHVTQVNYGVAVVTRPGLRRRNDLFFAQLLFHPGATIGDENDFYGNHLLFSPIVLTIAYRAVLPVYRPE